MLIHSNQKRKIKQLIKIRFSYILCIFSRSSPFYSHSSFFVIETYYYILFRLSIGNIVIYIFFIIILFIEFVQLQIIAKYQ